MTKIAVISDVHGNYIALKAVLKDMETKGVNKIYCLGDIAFKYGEPGKTTEAIRSVSSGVVRGNVDEYLINRFKAGESPAAKKDIMLNSHQNIDNIDWLENLPFFQDIQMSGQRIRLVHASPKGIDRLYNPNFDNSFNNRYDNKIIKSSSEFFDIPIEGNSNCKPDVVLFGHTHVTEYEKTKDGLIINPGSIGDPIIPQNLNNKHVDIPSPEISYIIIDGEEQVLNSPSPKGNLKVKCVRLPYLPILEDMNKLYQTKQAPILSSNEARENNFESYLMNEQENGQLIYQGDEEHEYGTGPKL